MSCRPGLQPRTPTILSGASDRPAILSGAPFRSELHERPSGRNQVLLEAAVEFRQLVEVGEGEDPLVPRVGFDVEGQADSSLDADRRRVADEHPRRRTRVIVRTR